MENFRNFLESSTIHGLAHIATGRKYVRLFWTLVVIVGFTGAGVLIYQSFQAWADSPVTTNVEIVPITDFTFPKVTVCPPKNTYTDLNYDLMKTSNMVLENDTRKELADYVISLFEKEKYENMMKTLNFIQDTYKFRDWYSGARHIHLQSDEDIISYNMKNTALDGEISTQNFGEAFEADKIFRPEHTVHITHVIPDRHRLKQIPGLSVNKKLPGMGIYVEAKKTSLNRRFIDELVVHKNIVTDTFNWTFYLGKDDPKKLVIGSYKRQALTDEDINEMSMDTMPGFHVRWAYSPNETELHPIWRPQGCIWFCEFGTREKNLNLGAVLKIIVFPAGLNTEYEILG